MVPEWRGGSLLPSFRESAELKYVAVVADTPDCSAPQWQQPYSHSTWYCQASQSGLPGSVIQQTQKFTSRTRKHGVSQVRGIILVNFQKNLYRGIGTESFSLFSVLVFQIILKNSRLVQSFSYSNYFWVHWAFLLVIDISLFSSLVSSWVLWLFFP